MQFFLKGKLNTIMDKGLLTLKGLSFRHMKEHHMQPQDYVLFVCFKLPDIRLEGGCLHLQPPSNPQSNRSPTAPPAGGKLKG